MMGVTLEALLKSREERHLHQVSLLSLYPGNSLVCMTVIMPGPVKRDVRSLRIAAAGAEAVRSAFSPAYEELRDLETGYEGYFIVPGEPEAVKAACCRLEETHPLGRLFDLDVIGEDGLPLSREALGFGPRRCLLCGNEARFCMRSHAHSYEELSAFIDRMVSDFYKNTFNL